MKFLLFWHSDIFFVIDRRGSKSLYCPCIFFKTKSQSLYSTCTKQNPNWEHWNVLHLSLSLFGKLYYAIPSAIIKYNWYYLSIIYSELSLFWVIVLSHFEPFLVYFVNPSNFKGLDNCFSQFELGILAIWGLSDKNNDCPHFLT